jgi:hypothetical protein
VRAQLDRQNHRAPVACCLRCAISRGVLPRERFSRVLGVFSIGGESPLPNLMEVKGVRRQMI